MKEWIEELLAEKQGMMQQMEILSRLVAYLVIDADVENVELAVSDVLSYTPAAISIEGETIKVNANVTAINS